MAQVETRTQDSAKSGLEFAEHSTNAVERMPLSAYWYAAIGSMALSAVLFVIGKRQHSNFVGLWVPSIISLALFYKLLRPSKEVREARRKVESNGF